jgi:hypothetical protein
MELPIKAKINLEQIKDVVLTKEKAVRYQGTWFKVSPRAYESERQTSNIAWMQIKEGVTPQEAYIRWFSGEQKDSKLLYPSFRKDE